MTEPKPKDKQEPVPANAEEKGALAAEDLDDVVGGLKPAPGGDAAPGVIDDDDPLIP